MALTFSRDRLEEMKNFEESKIGTKGLSDSGLTSIPKFFIHSPQLLANVTPKSPHQTPKIAIPTIDLSGINSPSHRPHLVAKLKEAARTWGFFHVVNHGVPQSTLDSTITAIKNFHERPEIKSNYYKREGTGVCLVKYSSNEDLFRTKPATWYDTLQVATSSPAGPLDPEEIPEVCRKEVVEWDTCAKMVGEGVMELLSEGLGLEAGKLKEMSFSERRYMAAHCYPHCPQPDLTLGIRAHTDTAFLTVLLQNEISGLQVKYGDEWLNVEPLQGGLIVNVGDFLQIVSNGEYKSVQHRVVANSYKEPRISVAIFFNPSKWQETGYHGPLPELLSPEKPALYRNFNLEEFLHNFYSKGLDSLSLVNKMRIESHTLSVHK